MLKPSDGATKVPEYQLYIFSCVTCNTCKKKFIFSLYIRLL